MAHIRTMVHLISSPKGVNLEEIFHETIKFNLQEDIIVAILREGMNLYRLKFMETLSEAKMKFGDLLYNACIEQNRLKFVDNCASINTNENDQYKINTTCVVESQGRNDANSTVEPLVPAEISKLPEIYPGSEPVFDEISDEGEPETLYPPLHQIEEPIESDRPIVFCRLAGTGYNFAQNPSLEVSKHEETKKIQSSAEDHVIITITNNNDTNKKIQKLG